MFKVPSSVIIFPFPSRNVEKTAGLICASGRWDQVWKYKAVQCEHVEWCEIECEMHEFEVWCVSVVYM